nr:hypothetical protein KitaXyl93_06360 [Kitasatospora sp. Xyl93]
MAAVPRGGLCGARDGRTLVERTRDRFADVHRLLEQKWTISRHRPFRSPIGCRPGQVVLHDDLDREHGEPALLRPVPVPGQRRGRPGGAKAPSATRPWR